MSTNQLPPQTPGMRVEYARTAGDAAARAASEDAWRRYEQIGESALGNGVSGDLTAHSPLVEVAPLPKVTYERTPADIEAAQKAGLNLPGKYNQLSPVEPAHSPNDHGGNVVHVDFGNPAPRPPRHLR